MKRKRKYVTNPEEIKKQESQIINLYNQGISIAEISQALKLSISTVYNRIAKLKKDGKILHSNKTNSKTSSKKNMASNTKQISSPKKKTLYSKKDINSLLRLYAEKKMFLEAIDLLEHYRQIKNLSKQEKIAVDNLIKIFRLQHIKQQNFEPDKNVLDQSDSTSSTSNER